MPKYSSSHPVNGLPRRLWHMAVGTGFAWLCLVLPDGRSCCDGHDCSGGAVLGLLRPLVQLVISPICPPRLKNGVQFPPTTPAWVTILFFSVLLASLLTLWETVLRIRLASSAVLFQRIFGHLLRPHETRGGSTTSISAYVWGLSLCLAVAVFVTSSVGSRFGFAADWRWRSAMGGLCLAWGDPFATLVGTRLGRKSEISLSAKVNDRARGKSLAGSLGFVVAATISCILVVSLLTKGDPVPSLIASSFCAAVGGAAAEALSVSYEKAAKGRIGGPSKLQHLFEDDNFRIPVVAALCSLAPALWG